MELKEIVNKTFERMKSYNPMLLYTPLRKAAEPPYDGAIWDDVMNVNGCANYLFSTCLMDVLKPKQVIELGGAMGTWSVCVLQTLPAESQLYSITLAEGGKEFMFVADKYENFHPIVGDDLNMDNWKGVDLSKTDIWYFDSIHSYEQLTKELNLYSPFFKKGALLLFDDIHINDEMEQAWKEIQDKYETVDKTDPLHWTGFGICKV